MQREVPDEPEIDPVASELRAEAPENKAAKAGKNQKFEVEALKHKRENQ